MLIWLLGMPSFWDLIGKVGFSWVGFGFISLSLLLFIIVRFEKVHFHVFSGWFILGARSTFVLLDRVPSHVTQVIAPLVSVAAGSLCLPQLSLVTSQVLSRGHVTSNQRPGPPSELHPLQSPPPVWNGWT